MPNKKIEIKRISFRGAVGTKIFRGKLLSLRYLPDPLLLCHHNSLPPNAVCSPRLSLSNYLERLIKKNVTGHYPMQVIPNGIDLDKFSPKLKKKQILMAGRLLPRKGFQHVLRGLQEVEDKDWSIHVLGDGPYRTKLKRLVKKSLKRWVKKSLKRWVKQHQKRLMG